MVACQSDIGAPDFQRCISGDSVRDSSACKKKNHSQLYFMRFENQRFYHNNKSPIMSCDCLSGCSGVDVNDTDHPENGHDLCIACRDYHCACDDVNGDIDISHRLQRKMDEDSEYLVSAAGCDVFTNGNARRDAQRTGCVKNNYNMRPRLTLQFHSRKTDKMRWLFSRQGRSWIYSPVFLSCILSVTLINLCSAIPSVSVDPFSFPDSKQENFVRELSDFHISWPSRVDHKREFLTHNIHPQRTPHRHKRDTSSFNSNSHSDDSVIHYKIPLHPDRDVIVTVRESAILLSPSAVVERKISQFRNISDSVFSLLDHHRGCHVTGHVLDDVESRVALSACKGLRGYVQHDGIDYMIEPVRGHSGREDGATPHVVYRRSALPDHLDIHRADRSKRSDDETSCGVGEKYDKIIANREKWERHRRSTTSARSQSSSSGSSHSRRKRSISTEKHVETLVVVDTDMVRYYENEDIETYVLTVMNMVATLFHDASIGNAINIVIVRILLLQDPDEDLTIMHHADKTLKNFCKWQKSINFRDDDHPNHHDVALLMTRKNICSRMNEPCSTLGLAQVAGLCQPHKTCSINEDTGLSLAWTVAHEMGHNFGMRHDTPRRGCVSTEEIHFVMAPHLTWDKTPYKWSDCSRDSITKFLDRNWGYCLDDMPGHHDFKYPLLPAGTMYDSDHQCALLYGEGAERCNGIEVLENICTTLWCRVNNKCSTKLQAAAVGTICGTDKWCFNGECVDIGDRPQAINGQWGEWSEWTSCTRTCGAGVGGQERHCNHPPPSNGGKYCTGERRRYRICNTDPCSEEAPSFRSHQCSEFNDIPYMDTKYEWTDIATPESPCQLHCKPKGMFFSVMLKDIVTDGTPCVIGSRHMCISGRCRHVGCDWVIDSDAKEDRCGVCYGDGSTCKTIKQQFNETKKLGYVEATVIPTGARNIRVEEVAEASNFLALKNEKGEYYLNGHWFIQWSGDYEVAGTVLHYKRLGNRESFNVPGPTKEPLHIMLLMQTHNPGVEFEYTVPKENATGTKKPEFAWEVTGWSHCTVSCGGGTQRAAVVCREQEMGVVDDIHCNASSKPDDRLRDCNSHLCPARWWTGPWQHCSVTCGEEGIHRRTVICVRSLGSDEQIALEDSACGNLKRPLELDVCHHIKKCPGLGTWETTEWSNCTRLCNGGVQYRKVVCVGGDKCDGEKPKSEQPCNENRCADQVEEAMMNLHEAGSSGESMAEEVPANERSITSMSKPAGSVINIYNNDDDKYARIKNEYTDDNLTDGRDLSDKNVLIGKDVGESTAESHDTRLEGTNENTNEMPPSYLDNVAGDTENRNTYNQNHHHRHRHHRKHHHHHDHHHQRNNDNQTPSDVPEHSITRGRDTTTTTTTTTTTSTTTIPPKVYRWTTRQWEKCSALCGSGIQSRDVACMEVTANVQVEHRECDFSTKPSTVKECYSSLCMAWQIGDWGECSATCGHAIRTRRLSCSLPGKCDPAEKPEETQVCSHLEACVSWVFGDWSQCSKSCGEGMQERLVQCVNLTSQQLSTGCGWKSKPHTKQSCNKRECPKENKAALTVACESNEMSFKVCRMLKKVGLCHKQYVQAKCCRTCQDHRRHNRQSRVAK